VVDLLADRRARSSRSHHRLKCFLYLARPQCTVVADAGSRQLKSSRRASTALPHSRLGRDANSSAGLIDYAHFGLINSQRRPARVGTSTLSGC
jgi:hypothetical protein